jgi:hypothetical protein
LRFPSLTKPKFYIAYKNLPFIGLFFYYYYFSSFFQFNAGDLQKLQAVIIFHASFYSFLNVFRFLL